MSEYISRFDGTDNRFLSNFYRCPIEFEGKVYSTSEHAFQAAKTFDDVEREKIRSNDSPTVAKKIGRRVALRIDWEEVKDKIMLEILRIKFQSGTELAKKLLATGDKTLIEGTTGWHDNYWGICSCDKCKGIGKNRLGELLMQVRKELKGNQDLGIELEKT